jgi:putative transposase
MCSVLDISASGYYDWRSRKPSSRDEADAAILSRIKAAYIESRKAYGSPRIHSVLKNQGIHCGRKRVARLMRAAGIKAQRAIRYTRHTVYSHGRGSAENHLKRKFHVEIPNRVWASDITSFWTGSGWMHLAVAMDLYSRRIIGWSMGSRITDGLPINALSMALKSRDRNGELMHHSDQGSQYGSEGFQSLLVSNGIQCSMSRKGNCYDNAVVESFFKTLKAEVVNHRRFRTREEARSVVFDYIEVFYNRKRIHSTLGYKSPVEYERQKLS